MREPSESELQSKLTTLFNHFSEKRSDYNSCMEEIFGSLDKGISYIYNTYNIFFTKETCKSKIQKNISILWDYMNTITRENNEVFYQCLSCIFGSFFGDALGGYCEFMEPNIKNSESVMKGNPQFGDVAGQVTDDSEMAMSLAYAILDNVDMRRLNPVNLYYYFGAWYYSGPNDVGNATQVALQHFKFHDFDDTMSPDKNVYFKNAIQNTKNENDSSLANGFLMRISPFIVWYYIRNKEVIDDAFNKNEVKEIRQKKLLNLYKLIKQEAKKNSDITHPNPETSTATSVFCIMAFGAIKGICSDDIKENLELLLKTSCFKNEKEEKDIKKIIVKEFLEYESHEGRMDYYEYFGHGEKNVFDKMGYYVHAFRLTLYYLYHFNYYKNQGKNIVDIAKEICNLGGDTDTNAAIVFAVIGPLFGFKNFGKNLNTIFHVSILDRYMFSPCLMVVYVYLLIETSNNYGKNPETNFQYLKMLLTFIFSEFKLESVDKMVLKERENVKAKITKNNKISSECNKTLVLRKSKIFEEQSNKVKQNENKTVVMQKKKTKQINK